VHLAGDTHSVASAPRWCGMLFTPGWLAEWFQAQPLCSGYCPVINSARHGWHIASAR
jgi:hypothetical protein